VPKSSESLRDWQDTRTYAFWWVDKDADYCALNDVARHGINMLDHYTFTLAEQVTKGQLRPLKQVDEADEWPL